MIKSICVYCGSSWGRQEIYAEAAREIGRLIAERGWRLIYGGGAVGLMGAVADAALAAGGEVIGVIPQALDDKELGHKGLTELRVVGSMHERKAMMAELSDAFLALPGGYGTWDELCEILTWAQLGFHRKPCGMLNTAGYYDAFAAQQQKAIDEGFLRDKNQQLLVIEHQPETLLEALARHEPPDGGAWLVGE